MDKSTKKNGSFYQAIDLGRFLCAVLVVAIHFSPFSGGADTEGTPQYVLNYFAGRIPVPFFFLCSGFFVFRQEDPNRFQNDRPRKSILKLVRLYLLWTIIYLPLSISEFQYDEAGLCHAALVYLRNLVFTGSYLHLWYLNASAFGMAMVTVFLHRKLSPGKIVALGVLLYIAGLLSQSWFGLLLPMKEMMPWIWINLKRAERVIGTARDGLFFGFLYISIGMMIALSGIQLKQLNALLLTCVFMAGWYGEICFVRKYGFSRANDMYILMVPAVLFLFLFLKELVLPEHYFYRKLRALCGLIYFTHELVGFGVTIVLERLSMMLPWLRFVAVLAGSLLISLVIIRISENRKFRLLAFLYR